jgi:hypothetical protein
VREPHGLKSGFEKLPLHSIIGLCHISFYSHKTFLTITLVEMMKHFISNKGAVSNESSWYKSTLIWTDNLRKDQLKPICYSFCDNL